MHKLTHWSVALLLPPLHRPLRLQLPPRLPPQPRESLRLMPAPYIESNVLPVLLQRQHVPYRTPSLKGAQMAQLAPPTPTVWLLLMKMIVPTSVLVTATASPIRLTPTMARVSFT